MCRFRGKDFSVSSQELSDVRPNYPRQHGESLTPNQCQRLHFHSALALLSVRQYYSLFYEKDLFGAFHENVVLEIDTK